MANFIDLTGKRFGRLTVKSRASNDKSGSARWNCICDCGNYTTVLGGHLRKGKILSCGCYMRECSSHRLKEHPTSGNLKHGMRHTRLYTIWTNMKTRCLNEKNRAYKWYGAVGVSICPEWMRFEGFLEWASKSGYQDILTIDRINPFGNYEPSNCRWVSKSEQRKNQRRSYL